MNKDVLQLMKNKFFKLSKSQKKISKYILDNYSKVAFMTAKELAKTTNVSESTVVRFAHALGFKGYPEFIDNLQENIKSKLTTVERLELYNDNNNKIMNLDIANIKKAIKNNPEENVKNVVNQLSNSKTIYILGLRSSEILADYLTYYLDLITNDTVIKKINNQRIFDTLVKINSKDTLVAIGFPRYSKMTLKALEYAESNNSTIVAITDSEVSPLTKFADYSLYADITMSSFIDSFVAPMSLINLLITKISMKNKDYVEEKFQKLEDVWNTFEIYNQ
ncbi:MAG: MurR/RpiR family transcriptional regulator [Bacillota bacterium]